MILPCLSLWQPWASFLVWGVKGPETRGWPCPQKHIGKPMLIHAAKRPARWSEGCIEGTTRHAFEWALKNVRAKWLDLPYGAILGVGTVRAVHSTNQIIEQLRRVKVEERPLLPGVPIIPPLHFFLGNYSPDRYAWLYKDLKALPEPIPYRGAQGIFNVEISDELALSLGLTPERAQEVLL